MDKLKRLEKLEKALNPIKNRIIITELIDGKRVSYERLPSGERKYYTETEVEEMKKAEGCRTITVGKASESRNIT